MKDRPVRPVERPVGLETEYGILKPGDPYANPVALASRLVAAYGAVSRPALTGPDGAPAPAPPRRRCPRRQQRFSSTGPVFTWTTPTPSTPPPRSSPP